MEELRQKRAVDFVSWYCDLLENHQERVFAYLSPTVTIDWFGRTSKGKDNVTKFLKTIEILHHTIENIESRSNICQRGGSPIRIDITSLDEDECDGHSRTVESTSIASSPAANANAAMHPANGDEDSEYIQNAGYHTPVKSSSVKINNKYHSNLLTKTQSMQYVVANGYFSAPTYDTQNRNNLFKMKIAYTNDTGSGEYVIWYIIYESKYICRRNLLSQFDKVFNDNITNKK